MKRFRKKRRPGNRPQTPEESTRIDRLKQVGCVCCRVVGLHGVYAQAHHLLSGGIRRGHRFTIALCPWHHEGRLIQDGWDHAAHRCYLGPSLAEGSRTFHAFFGSDDELLAKQDQLLLEL